MKPENGGWVGWKLYSSDPPEMTPMNERNCGPVMICISIYVSLLAPLCPNDVLYSLTPGFVWEWEGVGLGGGRDGGKPKEVGHDFH